MILILLYIVGYYYVLWGDIMIETDVVVVGAGPSGSTAAKHAALGGASVILIDKKRVDLKNPPF